MGISSEHPFFAQRSGEFLDCRTAYEGSRAIKAAGARYLPLLTGQTNAEYTAYKDRALFFAITAKTISAMVGMAMMRDPIVKHPDSMDVYFKENQGAQFMEFTSTTVSEVLLMGGYGVLIDQDQVGGDPLICRYTRESIINWRVDNDTGKPSMVVLKEWIVRAKADDEYEQEAVCQYRKLYLLNGVYTVQVFDEKGLASTPVQPTARGRTIDFIPFFLINPLGVSMDVMKPPMLDIVDINISHYRTSADLEHGRHFTGLPTPVVTGVEQTTLHIGSTVAWILPDPNAKATYLEFTGQGLGSLEHAMGEKQSQMATMSARMIDNSKRGSEAAETVRLRYMSETASLATVVRSVEEGLNLIYGTIADFMDTERPSVRLNKEFMDVKMSSQDLTAIVNAYVEGTMSKETLLYNFRKGDIVSPHQEDEAELAAIKEPPEQPAGGPAKQPGKK